MFRTSRPQPIESEPEGELAGNAGPWGHGASLRQETATIELCALNLLTLDAGIWIAAGLNDLLCTLFRDRVQRLSGATLKRALLGL